RRIPATEGVVEFRSTALVQYVQAGLQVVVEAMTQAHGKGTVAISVVIGIAGIGSARAVKAVGLFQAGVEAEAGLGVATGQAEAVLLRVMRAAGQANRGREAFTLTATGEYLHDTTHRIGAVDGGAGAAQHLDALDLIDAQVLQAGTSHGGGAHAHAINQNQALRSTGTANVQAVGRAPATVVGDLDAGHMGQQLLHAGWAQTVNIRAGKHADRSAGFTAGFGGARCRDHYLRQLQLFIKTRSFFGGEGRGGGQGDRQG